MFKPAKTEKKIRSFTSATKCNKRSLSIFRIILL